MPDEQDWSQFSLGTPAYYRIKTRDYLEGNWSNRPIISLAIGLFVKARIDIILGTKRKLKTRNEGPILEVQL